jgi:Flp pilus assembly protein TadG
MAGARDIRSEHGQTAVEFALVTPLIVVLLLAVIEVGITFNHYVTLTDAARAGARTAIVARFSGQSATQIAQSVRDAASNLDQAQLGVTVNPPVPTVSGSDVTVVASYPYSISILGWVVTSGTLSSTMMERVE